MKSILSSILVFCCLISFSQSPKPDFTKLTTLDFVKVAVSGQDLQNNIWQDSIVKLKELNLRGMDSENFEIIYYKFKTNYKKTLSQDEFYDGQIPASMTQFFKDLEKNCKVSFEDVVIKHKENGKLFKIMPLALLIKV